MSLGGFIFYLFFGYIKEILVKVIKYLSCQISFKLWMFLKPPTMAEVFILSWSKNQPISETFPVNSPLSQVVIRILLVARDIVSWESHIGNDQVSRGPWFCKELGADVWIQLQKQRPIKWILEAIAVSTVLRLPPTAYLRCVLVCPPP